MSERCERLPTYSDLQAEIERLRTALESIARDRWTRDPMAQVLQDIARRAINEGACKG